MTLARDLTTLDLVRPIGADQEFRIGVHDLAKLNIRKALLICFFVALLIPAYQEAAGLRLSPLRLFLLAACVPCGVQVFAGKSGKVTPTDFAIVLYSAWIFVALIVVHGNSQIPFAGITVIEALGGYFVGRVLVRSSQDFERFIKIMCISLIALAPFALAESLTGNLIIPDIIRNAVLSNTRDTSAYGRLGLERVYAVFEHPILFGLYCSSVIGSVFYILKDRPLIRVAMLGLAMGMTFLSLSSAPLLSCAIQVFLIAWALLTGGRWALLSGLLVFLYISIDLLSDRTPVTILIEQLTFNPLSGWTRIAIFDAGYAAALAHPVFGIGFNDWPRPAWLTDSVDNFWLLNAMRYGLVGGGFLIATFVVHTFCTLRVRGLDAQSKLLRQAYLITLLSISFTLCTVHVWGSIGVFVMFFLGAGVWFYSDVAPSSPKSSTPIRVPYSRFET